MMGSSLSFRRRAADGVSAETLRGGAPGLRSLAPRSLTNEWVRPRRSTARRRVPPARKAAGTLLDVGDADVSVPGIYPGVDALVALPAFAPHGVSSRVEVRAAVAAPVQAAVRVAITSGVRERAIHAVLTLSAETRAASSHAGLLAEATGAITRRTRRPFSGFAHSDVRLVPRVAGESGARFTLALARARARLAESAGRDAGSIRERANPARTAFIGFTGVADREERRTRVRVFVAVLAVRTLAAGDGVTAPPGSTRTAHVSTFGAGEVDVIVGEVARPVLRKVVPAGTRREADARAIDGRGRANTATRAIGIIAALGCAERCARRLAKARGVRAAAPLARATLPRFARDSETENRKS